MKNLPLRVIALFLRIFFPEKLYFFIKSTIIRKIRSFWLQPSFAHCDNSVLFGKIGRVHGGKCITIAKNTRFGDFCYLTSWPELVDNKPSVEIGAFCNFGGYNHISCTNKIVIGNNVLTGRWVTISDNNHGDTSRDSLCVSPGNRKIVSKGPIIIEDDVWIGDKATVLAGVHIGKGAVVAANAVVTKNVPCYSVAAGNPARIIKSV